MKNFFTALIFAIIAFSCSKNGQELHQGKLIDLTYDYDSSTVYWPTADNFKHDTVSFGINNKGYFYSSFNYGASEHGGTHIDAPVHFAEGGGTVETIPLEAFFGKGITIDVAKKAESNRDYLVSVEDFTDWEKVNGKIEDGSIILLNTGWGKYYYNKEQYMGTSERGPDAVAKLHFPGLSPEAAEWLVKNKKIKVVGIDTPSIDFGQSTMFDTHKILCKNNIYAVENVANLDKMPAKGYEVYVFPMKIKGGSGAPVRMVAKV
jgi:kynurenine formamidase